MKFSFFSAEKISVCFMGMTVPQNLVHQAQKVQPSACNACLVIV